MFLRSFIVLAFFAKFLLPICDFNYEYVGMNYEIWMDGAISEYGEVWFATETVQQKCTNCSVITAARNFALGA